MPIQLPTVQTGFEASVDAARRKIGTVKIDAGLSSKSITDLSRPLGKITGQADEFTKSMEAANARVLAFGASVGVLSAVTQGFKEIIGTTIQVEKSLADINSVLGANAKELNKFKNDIFKIAKETGNSFKTVADAALEISRQGGDPSLVLTKLKDSMILARLSGLDAASAVEGLSAAVNSFSKEGITTSEVLNKISKTAAKFAVSERDLIEGFKRSASVAQQAGVSIDELGGIITAVQQKTARGGAVIGNAFKTIFTRIRNPESLEALQNLGIEVTNVATGKLLPATKLIENLAQKMDKLNDIQLGEISLTVGGGFQIGPLLAALDDMSSKTSIYSEATKDMATAGTEAYQRNIALNQTLAAAINVSVVSLQELANTLGEIGVTDNLKNLLGFFNSFINEVQNTLNGEGLGSDLAKGLVKGIANVLSGPGLAIFGVIVAKLTLNFAQFGIQALKTFLSIGSASKEIKAIESTIASTLLNNKSIQTQILALEGDRVAQAKFFSTALNTQLATMEKMRTIAASIAPAVYGATTGVGKPRAAGGYMPTVMAEANDIKKGVGGARPSDRPVVIPNFAFGGGKTGTMVANTGEHIVPNYNGGSGSAIFNRDMVGRVGLPQGARKIGASGGFIPNFVAAKKEFVAPPSNEDQAYYVNYYKTNYPGLFDEKALGQENKKIFNRITGRAVSAAEKAALAEIRAGRKKENRENTLQLNADGMLGIVSVTGSKGSKQVIAKLDAANLSKNELAAAKTIRKGFDFDAVAIKGIESRSLDTLKKNPLIAEKGQSSSEAFRDKIKNLFTAPILQLAQDIMPGVFQDNDYAGHAQAIMKRAKDPYIISNSAMGAIFESAVALSTSSIDKIPSFGANDQVAPFDFEETNVGASSAFKKAFEFENSLYKADAKKTETSETISSLVGKSLRDKSVLDKLINNGVKGSAAGYIPNFADETVGKEISKKSGSDLHLKDGILKVGFLRSREGNPLFEIARLINENKIKAIDAGGIIGPKIPDLIIGLKKMIERKRVKDPSFPRIKIKGHLRPGYLAEKISEQSEYKYKHKHGDSLKYYTKGYDYYGRKDQRNFVSAMDQMKLNRKDNSFIQLEKLYPEGFAKGYIPNFANPLNEAISREIGAGVNPSQVYIDQNNSLKGPMNPSGLMVANRRDEPAGGFQGINRARKEGANPKSYGAANGFIPNYANTGNKTDTNMLTKLLTLQIGISMLTGFLDQAGDSSKKFSEGLNKVMTTLLIFGTFIYSGPMKSLKAFSDRLNKTSQKVSVGQGSGKENIAGMVQGGKTGFALGLRGKGDLLKDTINQRTGEIRPSKFTSKLGERGIAAAQLAAPIGSVIGGVGAAIGAVAGPALMAVGAFKAINDFAGAFVMPSKDSASALGKLSIVASQAASSLSEFEVNAAQASTKTSKATNSIGGMTVNTLLSGFMGAFAGTTQTRAGFKGTQGKANLQLSGISEDDFSKLQEDFTKVYLAANKEGSLKAREYNAKRQFEKTVGIDSENAEVQRIGEVSVFLATREIEKNIKIAKAKRGTLSIDEQIQRVEELILKDGQRQIDLANQRAITVLKTKNLLDGSLSLMDKAVLSNQILNNLTEKQSDELNARVALRDREVQFGESQLNNLNQQIQAYDGVTTSLEAVKNYQDLSRQYSEDGLLTQEELVELARKALLVQKSYTDDGQKLNEFGAAQLEIKKGLIERDIEQKNLADKQAAAREKETAALKEQLNTRESILAVAQRTAQAESFSSNFSAQQKINANNLAIAKLGLQQPTSQAGTRALNLQKANLEAANVPLEADKTRTDVTKQFRDELIELAKKTKDTGHRFATLSGDTKKYSDISTTLTRLEYIKSQYLSENNGKEDDRTRAIDESIKKFEQLGITTDQEIKQKALLSQVAVEQAKQVPVIQDLVGKLSDFAESLKAATVELQFKKLSETTGQGMLDLTSEQKLNAALQSAGTDKTQISEAYSQAAMTKDQQRLSLATSGKDISAITYDLEINKEILAIKKEAVDQDQLTEEQLERIIALEQKRVNKGSLQKFKEAFSETEFDRANRFTDTLVSGAVKFRDTMIDGISTAIEQGESLSDILQGAALDFAREMTKTNLTNMFSMGQSAVGSLFQGYASGGKITGGSGNKDDVPAMLMGGEYVMNKRAVSKYGTGFMDALNNGSISGYAKGGSVIRGRGLGSDVVSNSDSLQQSGRGGFQMPGYYGSGSITGKKKLLSFATQAYTSGQGDIIQGGSNSAFIDITPESVRLTNFGRNQGPAAAAVKESKKEALDLYFQQLAAEKQAKEEEAAKKKEFRKMLLMAGITTVAGAGIGVAKTGWQEGLAKTGTLTGAIKGVGEKFGNVGSSLGSLFTGDFKSASQYASMAITNFQSGVPKALMVNSGISGTSGTIGKSISARIKSPATYQNSGSVGLPVDFVDAIGSGSGLSSLAQSEIAQRKVYATILSNRGYSTAAIRNIFQTKTSKELRDFVYVGNPIMETTDPTKRATGGIIPQTSGIDTVPAMLSGGEFIMNAGATQRIGASNLNAMNSGASTVNDSSAINDQLINKLDELIRITKESSKPVTVNVSSQQGQAGSDQTAGNESEKDQNLSRKIKAAVVAVLQEEKRLGGVLRRS